MYQIEHYLSANEQKDLYIAWLRNLRDSKARVAVIRRVMRMEQAPCVTIDVRSIDLILWGRTERGLHGPIQ